MMLDTILKWMQAGDDALLHMGPLMAILLSLLGGYGATQLAKFPLVRLFDGERETLMIRLFASLATGLCLVALADLPLIMVIIVALLQPWIYKVVMLFAYNKWPWLEATRVGSVRPSDEAKRALEDRKP